MAACRRNRTGLFCAALLAAAVMMASTGTASAAGFAINEQGAAATGRACAVTAVADTPSAVFYNPAGLAFQEGLGLELGDTLIFPLASHEDPGTGTVTDAEFNVFYPPSLYLSYLVKEKVALAFGFFVPYGLGVQWPRGWLGFQEVEHIALQVFTFNPSVAWSPAAWLSIGGGVDIAYATVELAKGINFIDEHGEFEAAGKALGIGGNAGLLMKFWGGRFNFGLNYRSSVSLDFAGDGDFTVPDTFGSLLEDQPLKTSLTLPHVLTIGFAGRPIEMLSISLDLTVTGWSSFEEFGIEFPEDIDRDEDEKLTSIEPRNWRNVIAVRLGAEVTPKKWLAVRAGLAYDQSPSPDSTLSPTLPDSSRILVAAGAGFNLPRGFVIDVAYMYVHMLERTASGESFPGTYNASAHLIGVSFGYRWVKKKK